MAGLQLENIHKSYGSVEVIRDISLDIEEGEFVVLVGPSGCGKSTLLRCIAGLEPVTKGRLVQDGIDITGATPVDRGVAMVFQTYALYPHMTVAENIGFGLRIAGENKAKTKERVLEIATLLKLRVPPNPQAASSIGRSAAAGGHRTSARPESPSYSCSMSRCPTLTLRCAPRCAWSWPSSIPRLAIR